MLPVLDLNSMCFCITFYGSLIYFKGQIQIINAFPSANIRLWAKYHNKGKNELHSHTVWRHWCYSTSPPIKCELTFTPKSVESACCLRWPIISRLSPLIWQQLNLPHVLMRVDFQESHKQRPPPQWKPGPLEPHVAPLFSHAHQSGGALQAARWCCSPYSTPSPRPCSSGALTLRSVVSWVRRFTLNNLVENNKVELDSVLSLNPLEFWVIRAGNSGLLCFCHWIFTTGSCLGRKGLAGEGS